jgi:Uma2 family endonuclease
MSAVPNPKSYSAEEYLAMERQSLAGKCELIDGQIYAMVGASREHNLINVNLTRLLSTQFRGRPCEAYANDMRVKAAKSKSYYYPDIVIVCGKPEFEDAHVDTLLNPAVLIEVLSASTEAHDRGGKFLNYRQIASLREYLLVSQDKPLLEHYTRHGESWVLTEVSGLEGILELQTVPCCLPMREIYERIFDDYTQ